MALDFLPISLTWLLLAILPVLFYLYAVRPMQVFKKMGVPGPTPLPLLGNLLLSIKNGVWNYDAQRERTQLYGSVYGYFLGITPMLFISDPELIREVFVKKFHSFTNRQAQGTVLETKPSCRMLLSLEDQDWKNVRSTLRPAFSSAKLKLMVEGVSLCADQLLKNIASFAETGESFDTKELTGAFTLDAIARTAFGIEIDSQRNPEDTFVVHAKKTFKERLVFFNPIANLYRMFPTIMTPILEMIKYDTTVPRDVSYFFYGIFDQLVKMRRKNYKGRVDLMQLMADAHEEENDESEETNNQHGRKQALTRDDVVANGITFFLAGYDTTASTTAFAMYNLAQNQEAQDKAREDVKKAMTDRDMLDYEAVQQMPYLEMCMMETLRLYSPFPSAIRCASEDVKLKQLNIPKDMLIGLPILAIHYDPERWPEPKKFIPERFTKEEREKRDPYDWLPFGAGPRSCIGMRLALMVLKVGLAKILMKYRIVTAPDTEIPVKIKKSKLLVTPENGIRLKVEMID